MTVSRWAACSTNGRTRPVSIETTGAKSLAVMTAEVVENNIRLGWHENPPTVPEAMAMLHSEVSEALEAWRRWGTDDVTDDLIRGLPHIMSGAPRKPEGVGSEFADIFIRLLDDAWLYAGGHLYARTEGLYALNDSFPANMNALHDLISMASGWWEGEGNEALPARFAAILVFLHQLCDLYGIDLAAEYERKMAYNRTREYRHGGKRI
jgi:hypothetical protein